MTILLYAVDLELFSKITRASNFNLIQDLYDLKRVSRTTFSKSQNCFAFSYNRSNVNKELSDFGITFDSGLSFDNKISYMVPKS